MKHLESFHGSVTAALVRMGLDSKKVLDGVNSWIGSIEADPEKTTTKAGAKLTGQVTTKGVDKRVVTIRESEKRQSKQAYGPAAALYALNTAMKELTERHGITATIEEFPAEVHVYVNRDTWKVKARKAPSDTIVEEETVPTLPA